MTELPCACPRTNVQAMGAVRATGLIWVAVLKRDPLPPVCPEQRTHEMPPSFGRGSFTQLYVKEVMKC